MSSESPGFIKCQPRYLYLHVAKASQSQRMCEAVSNACLHLSHSRLFTSLSLNRCPLKWQCPISILSWFLLRFSNSSIPCRGFLKQILSLSLPTYGLPMLVMFPILSSPQSLPWQPLQLYQGQAKVFLGHVRSLVWLIHQLFHFHYPGTHTNWILLCSVTFTRD